ncbi:protein-export protein SecB [Alphaproteobacteria bacterium]|nr:protein-export protein SecB [Alphaproteobacteria bacterium]GHT00124.1 protein-export protein SecB [Alphaproteobacteria bacterium]
MAEKTLDEAQGSLLPFVLHLQYLKDLSLENPTPLLHLTDGQDVKPEISINVQVNARHLTERMFEVILEINADAKRGDSKMFICQVQYAGLVALQENLEEDRVRTILLEDVPALLFPFARNVVADATRETGLPPLLLQPVDFAALNTAQKEKNEEQSSGQIH